MMSSTRNIEVLLSSSHFLIDGCMVKVGNGDGIALLGSGHLLEQLIY
jgi:hypothetical protein